MLGEHISIMNTIIGMFRIQEKSYFTEIKWEFMLIQTRTFAGKS